MSKPEIRIIRQNRRSLMMRPVPGALEVYIPYQLRESDGLVQDFIQQGLAKIGDTVPEVPQEKTSRDVIHKIIDTYSERLNVQPTRVQLRDMTRKWGSCSRKGTVTLNTRLGWLDRALVEYVVCHELAHLIELNHSERFWTIVEQHMPDYRERMVTLRQVEGQLW